MENKLANKQRPLQLYRLAQKYSIWLLLFACLLIGIAWVWGLGFAPADAKQREGFRIIYAHVPAASLSMSIYALMGVCAFCSIVWKNKICELLMMSMAPIGATFTFIALVTGSIWGSVMWGTWWVWDARLTSELILLFLYLGAIGLYHTFDNHQNAGQVVAILILACSIILPIIHYSVEWWSTLHQPSTQFHQTVNPLMRTPLRLALLGNMILFLSLMLYRFKGLLLQNSLRRGWGIEKLITKE